MDVVTTILLTMALCGVFVTLFMDLLATGKAGLTDKDLGEPIKWIQVGVQGLVIILLFIVLWDGMTV